MESQQQVKTPAVQPQTKGKAKKGVIECEDDSSQWSLQSLEDMKGINIHQLQEMQSNLESKPKEKQFFEVKFPQKPSVLASAPLHEIGKVIFIVGQLWILQASSATFVVDLDNWVADQNRNLLGFVIDVLGKVESPFYAIKPEKEYQASLYLGKSLYYIEGSSKILKDDDIKSMQSKSAMEAVQDVLSSSDDDEQKERDFSNEKQEKQQMPWKRQNKFKEQQDVRRSSRERTRQQKPSHRNLSRSRNEHNQRYLEGMYRRHYNEMLQLEHGFIPRQSQSPFVNQPLNPQQFPQIQNPFMNQQLNLQQFPHSNVAQFGSSNAPQQFYGQVYQPNLFQGQPGLFMTQQFQNNPQQVQQFQNSAQQGLLNPFNQGPQGPMQNPKFGGNNK